MAMFQNSEFGGVTAEELATMDKHFGSKHTPSSGSGPDSAAGAAAGEAAGQNFTKF